MAESRLITPSDQIRNIDPYQQRVFEYGTTDSDYYLSRAANYLLYAIGNDVVLNGLDVSLSYGSAAGLNPFEIKFTVSPGVCIADSTLGRFPSSNELIIDVGSIDQNNTYIICYVRYQYLQIIHANNSMNLILNTYNTDNNTVGDTPYPWDSNKDRILLAIVSFTKDAFSVTGVQKEEGPITIGGRQYYLHGSNNFNLHTILRKDLENELPANDGSVIAPLGLGGVPGTTDIPTFRRCTIDETTGNITAFTGKDVMLNSQEDDTPDQQFKAMKVWAAVYNDLADFQYLDDETPLIYGKCYYKSKTGLKICDVRCQKGVMGIASDTFGYALGVNTKDEHMAPIGISGWVLAYVDQEYEPGTPLTNSEDGILTEMSLSEKSLYPERLVAIYDHKELSQTWGPENHGIKVDGRHWVKIK